MVSQNSFIAMGFFMSIFTPLEEGRNGNIRQPAPTGERLPRQGVFI